MKNITRTILTELAVDLCIALGFGSLVAWITKSVEAGFVLGLSLFIISLRSLHPGWGRRLVDGKEEEAPPLLKGKKVQARPMEMAGMTMLGLVLGLFTYLFSHSPLASILVCFLSVAAVLSLHFVRRKGGAPEPENNEEQ